MDPNDEPDDPDKREYLADGITPKHPRHLKIECETGRYAGKFTKGPKAPHVVFPPYGTAFTHPVE